MTPASIEVQHLSLSVGDRQLLRDANLTVPAGELVVLVGISGGGKSTLLRVLAGLEPRVDSDRAIEWSGSVELHPSSPNCHIGLVFQHPALLDEWTAEKNIQLAIDHQGSESSSAVDWLDRLQVPRGIRISRLSGGQRQRLSLAQALASQPAVMIYDEPTTGLDRSTGSEVARLIRQIQQDRHVTSLVVTHDFESFLPVADRLILLDSIDLTLREIPLREPELLAKELDRQFRGRETKNVVASSSQLKAKTSIVADMRHRAKLGAVSLVLGAGRLVDWTIAHAVASFPRWPSWIWGLRFFAHYARLVFGLTAIVYLSLAGAIIGFVATYFSLRFMPYKIYTQPLLLEELLGAVGFSLARILIPILTTILVASRCAAAVSADLGSKRYGGQIESMQMLRIPPDRYLQSSVLWSFVLGTLLLNQVAYTAARLTSMLVFTSMYPDLGTAYWDLHFHLPLSSEAPTIASSFAWTLVKLIVSAAGISMWTYHLALRTKLSTSDISKNITTTILFCTLWVLIVHMIVALYEFGA